MPALKPAVKSNDKTNWRRGSSAAFLKRRGYVDIVFFACKITTEMGAKLSFKKKGLAHFMVWH